MQLLSGSMYLFSALQDIRCGWMKGGRVSCRSIIRGYDFSVRSMRLAILSAPILIFGRWTSDRTVFVGIGGIEGETGRCIGTDPLVKGVE